MSARNRGNAPLGGRVIASIDLLAGAWLLVTSRFAPGDDQALRIYFAGMTGTDILVGLLLVTVPFILQFANGTAAARTQRLVSWLLLAHALSAIAASFVIPNESARAFILLVDGVFSLPIAAASFWACRYVRQAAACGE